MTTHFAVAKRMGISEDEIWEAVQVAASCGAGTILSMAERSQIAAGKGHKYWLPG